MTYNVFGGTLSLYTTTFPSSSAYFVTLIHNNPRGILNIRLVNTPGFLLLHNFI